MLSETAEQLSFTDLRPCEPWDHIAHALLDMLEQMAVLPEPPQREDDDSDGDGEFDQFADDEDEEPLDQTMVRATKRACEWSTWRCHLNVYKVFWTLRCTLSSFTCPRFLIPALGNCLPT